MASQPKTGPKPNLERRETFTRLRDTGMSLKQIAAQFNISKQAVGQIIRPTAKPWAERQDVGLVELSQRGLDAAIGSEKLLAAILRYNAKHHGDQL